MHCRRAKNRRAREGTLHLRARQTFAVSAARATAMSKDSILKEAEEAFSFFQPPRTSATRARNMLSTQNLEVALRSLGLRPPSARDWDEYAEVREAGQAERFQYVNEQGKGQLDWEDFRFIVEHRLAHRDTPADLLQAFKVFDPAGTGRVSTVEMKKVLTALGNKLTTAEINEMITEADFDGSGEIDYVTFVDVIMSQ